MAVSVSGRRFIMQETDPADDKRKLYCLAEAAQDQVRACAVGATDLLFTRESHQRASLRVSPNDPTGVPTVASTVTRSRPIIRC